MNRPCPWRSNVRAIGIGRGMWIGLAWIAIGALASGELAVAPARAEDGGIEIGADPSAPTPPARPRPDTARAGSRPAVPVPPTPPDVDAELERARERMAHEQARLEEERAELDRAQERVDRQRHIGSRRGEERGQRGEIVRMGSDVVIEAGEIVSEVVVIGGDLEVDGEVDGDAVAVGGDVTIGPGARISGDVVAVGGHLEVAPGAIIEGDEVEVGTGAGILRGLGGGFNRDHEGPRRSPVGGSLLTLLILLFIGWLAAVLAGERLGALAEVLAQDWLRALLTGVLVLVLWLPAVFLSAITIIGIPVAIFLILTVPLLIFVGYLIGATALGRRVSIGIGRPTSGPLQSIIFGILVIGLLAFIGRVLGLVGFLGPFGVAFRIVSYALFSFAATSGLGVIALALWNRFRSRAPGVAPPAPPPAPPLPPSPPAEPGESAGSEPSGPHPGEPSQAPA